MDALVGIYEAAMANDWLISSIKLVLIPTLCICIGKCIDTIRYGMSEAYIEE